MLLCKLLKPHTSSQNQVEGWFYTSRVFEGYNRRQGNCTYASGALRLSLGMSTQSTRAHSQITNYWKFLCLSRCLTVMPTRSQMMDSPSRNLAGSKEGQRISEKPSTMQPQIPHKLSAATSPKTPTELSKTDNDEDDESEESMEGEGEDVTDMVRPLFKRFKFLLIVALLADDGTT